MALYLDPDKRLEPKSLPHYNDLTDEQSQQFVFVEYTHGEVVTLPMATVSTVAIHEPQKIAAWSYWATTLKPFPTKEVLLPSSNHLPSLSPVVEIGSKTAMVIHQVPPKAENANI